MILPVSYPLSSEHLDVDHQPFASGGYGDIFEGTLDGSKVCVKRVRVYSKDILTKTKKVCFSVAYLPLLTRPVDLLPGGCSVETLETPEDRSLLGYHSRPFPAYLGLDAWRGSGGTYQKEPQCRPT